MKDQQNFLELILRGESETLEFKSNFNDQVIETIAAFSNSVGGTILIGIDSKGNLSGISTGKETIQNWVNEIKQKTSPSVYPEIRNCLNEGKTIIMIDVPEFPVKPVSFKGRFFKRIGNSNHLMSAFEITQMSIQSSQTSWDAFPARKLTINDLDVLKVSRFLEKVKEKGRYPLQNDWKENLEKLRLINGETITNAAWLLFGKEAPGYNVHIGRFKTPSLIIDDKMLNETLFETVEESMRYIIGQIKVAFEITGMPTSRTEIFEYPLPALRELVLNSIIHRDYLSPIDIQIKIFDNSISFYNPGGLFGNLTINDLKKDNYRANARNKLIAEAFYLTGDVEKYGTGFIRIRKEIGDYRTMVFDFDEIPNGFLAALKYKTQKISTKDDTVNDTVNDTVKRSDNILKEIEKNPYLSYVELSRLLKISRITVVREMGKMKKLGLIERVGSDKKGYWKILNTPLSNNS